MSFNTRIKERREQLHLTRSELADKIGVTQSAISNYENAISSPKIELLYKLFNALKCDANYLYQDEMQVLTYANTATPEEFEKLVKPYRSLDPLGQSHVDSMLNWELDRTTQAKEADNTIKQLQQQFIQHAIPSRFFAYYGKIAAAGTSVKFSDLTAGVRPYPENELNKNADYVIGVIGSSMEPEYSNGDIVYIQKTDHIDTGDIGIFQKGNNIYIKKVSENKLISLNPNYPPLTDDGDRIIVLGKVLGKAEGI